MGLRPIIPRDCVRGALGEMYVAGWFLKADQQGEASTASPLLKVDRGALIPTRAFEGAVPMPST